MFRIEERGKEFKIPHQMSRGGGSGYRTYIFEESTRYYIIYRKGQGRKEVIYLHVANVSCTRGVRESTGLSYGGPYSGVP